MKLKHLAASLLIVLSGVAAAAPTYLGVLDGEGAQFERAWSRYFGRGSTPGDFVDSYSFDLEGATGARGSTYNFSFGSLDLVLDKITLFLTSNPGNAVEAAPGEFSFSASEAGNYMLNVSGTVSVVAGNDGGAYYEGRISSFTSPAPEPESLAMALAGLAAIGLALARRRKP